MMSSTSTNKIRPEGSAFKLCKNTAGEFQIVPFDDSVLPEPRNGLPAEGTEEKPSNVKNPNRRGTATKLLWNGKQLVEVRLGPSWHHYPGQPSDEELDDEYGSDDEDASPFEGSSGSVSTRQGRYRDASALSDSAEMTSPSTTPPQSRHSSLSDQDAEKLIFYGRFDWNGNWVTRVHKDKYDGPKQDEIVVSKPAPLPSERKTVARTWWKKDTGRVWGGNSVREGHLGCLNWAEDRGLVPAKADSPKGEDKVPKRPEAVVGCPYIWPIPSPSRL